MAGNNLPAEKNNRIENINADNQRIIVIGASAGGFEAIKKIVQALPGDFSSPIFIVWHMAPGIRGVLPDVLNGLNTIYAAHAYDKEPIKPNRIYIAPPDHHLLIEENIVRITKGPKENRFRPAVDPLFRSAAYAYGKRVTGVILSGALDDGTAGLWTIKHSGGIAIVQDPNDAEVPSMPQNAMLNVKVDHSVPVSALASLLTNLSKEKIAATAPIMKDEKTKAEIQIAAEDNALKLSTPGLGELSRFSCPECHGVLSKLKDGNLVRFRCHTGHAYSMDTLLASISEKIEDSLYSAIRGIDESIMLLNHIGDHYAEVNDSKLAALYFKKALEAEARSGFVRKAALSNEQFSKDSLLEQMESGNNNDDIKAAIK